jgi:hypothetical protein
MKPMKQYSVGGCIVGITGERDLSYTPLIWPTWLDVYIPSFLKIYTGYQSILRFCLGNLKCCNIGITDVKGFMS